MGNILPMEDDSARIRFNQPGNEVKKGRLASAIWSDHRGQFSLLYIKRDRIDCPESTKVFGQSLGCEDRHRFSLTQDRLLLSADESENPAGNEEDHKNED